MSTVECIFESVVRPYHNKDLKKIEAKPILLKCLHSVYYIVYKYNLNMQHLEQNYYFSVNMYYYIINLIASKSAYPHFFITMK